MTQGALGRFEPDQMLLLTHTHTHTRMQGALGRFEPDQMQAVNSIMVIVLIPIFQTFVYPGLTRLRIPNSSLQVRPCACTGLVSFSCLYAFLSVSAGVHQIARM